MRETILNSLDSQGHLTKDPHLVSTKEEDPPSGPKTQNEVGVGRWGETQQAKSRDFTLNTYSTSPFVYL